MVLKRFYNLLQDFDQHKQEIVLHHSFVNDDLHELPHFSSLTTDSMYVSKDVFDIKDIFRYKDFYISFNNTNIRLFILLRKTDTIESYADLIETVCLYVYILNTFEHKKAITIYLGNSSVGKKFYSNVYDGSNPLGAKEVNSGYKVNDYIFVYRKEEVKKVILHELVHFYDLHPQLNDNDFNMQPLEKLYNIQPSVNGVRYFEAYTELITSIWLILIKSYLSLKGSNKNESQFIKIVKSFYNVSINHMLIQLCFILRYYKRDTLLSNPIIVDNTHVFAYFFVKTALMINIGMFLKTYGYGKKIDTRKDSITFLKLVNYCMRSKKFIKAVNDMFKLENKSLRMMPFDL